MELESASDAAWPEHDRMQGNFDADAEMNLLASAMSAFRDEDAVAVEGGGGDMVFDAAVDAAVASSTDSSSSDSSSDDDDEDEDPARPNNSDARREDQDEEGPQTGYDDVDAEEVEQDGLAREGQTSIDRQLPDLAPNASNREPVGSAVLKELIGEYVVGQKPRSRPSGLVKSLSSDQKLSLLHYRRWLSSGGTYEAYKIHAKTLRELGRHILSLFKSKSLAAGLVDFRPRPVDMCVNSCIAFVGPYKELQACPWMRKDEDGNTVQCQEPRYDRSGRPRRQYTTLTILDRIRSMYHNPELSQLLQYRHDRLGALRAARDNDSWNDFVFQDVTDGILNLTMADERGLFQSATDVAISIYTDGAQLVANKDSSAWIITAACLNMPPTIRFRRAHQLVLAIIPGPNPPEDIESFFRPVLEEMAALSLGAWVWHGAQEKWFLMKAYLVGLYADPPGSSKMNKMTGTQGRRGCRFCVIEGCYGKAKPPKPRKKAKRKKGSRSAASIGQSEARTKSRSSTSMSGIRAATTVAATASRDALPLIDVDQPQRRPAQEWANTPYFPLTTPSGLRTLKPNLQRPSTYDPADLPMRDDEAFYSNLKELADATSKTAWKRVATKTGVTALPLLAFSPAFSHPDFFPLDIFHLFSFNTFQLIWNTMSSDFADGDPFHFDEVQRDSFGKLVAAASYDLPGSFGKAPRDTSRSHNTHYKMVGWITVFHCYIGPFLHSHNTDESVIKLLLALLDGIGVAAQATGCQLRDIGFINASFIRFGQLWEELYIRDNPDPVQRARLSVHLLLHIGHLIVSTGSVRGTSQAACERTIGTIKKEMRSQRNPYVAVEGRVLLIEQVHSLELLLDADGDNTVKDWRRTVTTKDGIHLGASTSLNKMRKRAATGTSVSALLRALAENGYAIDEVTLHVYAQITRLGETFTIRSRCSNSTKTTRLACRVAHVDDNDNLSFFDTVAFAQHNETGVKVAVGRRFIQAQERDYNHTNHWICGS
ncbi:hypothetical protein CF327_g4741 [Tilletia walkeri]|nr:hypothetical protein CF327_g4741 [Tilletia walkeri]